MMSNDETLTTGLRAWVASTLGKPISVPDSRRISQVLAKVKGSEGLSLIEGSAGDSSDLLAALSLWSYELRTLDEPSEEALRQASIGCNVVSRLESGLDEFGELKEIERDFAFVGWRHARALGQVRLSQEWLARHDRALAGCFVERECLDYFLGGPFEADSSALSESFLSSSEQVLALCSVLRQKRNSSPSQLADKLPGIYSWLDSRLPECAFRDERASHLGQIALTMAACVRLAGQDEEMVVWLERAKKHFDASVDCDVGATEVTLVGLARMYDIGSAGAVLSATPALLKATEDLGMAATRVKTLILRGSAFKRTRRYEESLGPLKEALASPIMAADPNLRALALEGVADSLFELGRYQEAMEVVKEGISTVEGIGTTFGSAWMKILLGSCHLREGDSEGAVLVYEEAERAYAELRLPNWTAYCQLLCADVLLSLNRDGEAENKIRSALPALERGKMVVEAVAALAILRESLRRQKADPRALRELVEHLRKGN